MKPIYQTRNEYYADHQACPKCGGTKNSQTYAGYVFIHGEPYQDLNRCECACGWAGIVDDLVPTQPPKEK